MYKDISLDAPNVGEMEKKHLVDAIDSGFVSTAGPYVSEFEKLFAEHIGIEKAVSTQSGTAALHIALHELGIGQGDEVIVPALTFVATVNPILYVGAKPVFVDIDAKTWNINIEEISKNITPKTKAIIPVHLYGNPCNMSRILEMAKASNIFVIEDATESLGAKYQGQHTGTIGDLGCFSFNGNKVITTGGGGMVVGRDRKRLEHIKFLANQAKDSKKSYYHPEIGFNYRMTNIEAALGIAQLKRLESFLAQKKRINEIYKNELLNLKQISFQEEYAQGENSSWLTCIIFENELSISTLQKTLKGKGIPSRRVFMPIVEFDSYRAYKHSSYKNSYDIYNRGLCLPSSTLNSEKDICHVCDVLKEAI